MLCGFLHLIVQSLSIMVVGLTTAGGLLWLLGFKRAEEAYDLQRVVILLTVVLAACVALYLFACSI